MRSPAPARAFALACLLEAQRSGRFVREVALGAPSRPRDERDGALGLRLALGVTATVGCLDEILDRHLDRPRAVAPAVRAALRIAAYELVYGDVPAHVAVSQGVELVGSCARRATGLANAVLRRVGDEAATYRAAADVAPAVRRETALAREAGLPVWLLRSIAASVGDKQARALVASQLEPALPAAHVNPARPCDNERFTAATFPSPCGAATLLPGALVPARIHELVAAGAFDAADAVASDVAAQLIATAATRQGTTLEIGAGRGTKTFIMACQAQRAGFSIRQVPLDVSARKGELNRARLERAGFSDIHPVTGDGRALDTALAAFDGDGRTLFDTVVVDAPCSGTGTMRRHPEIPWRLDAADVDPEGQLPRLQGELLAAAAQRVAPAGELFYATCSVLASENRSVIDRFLASPAGAGFILAPVSQADIFALPAFAPAASLLRDREDAEGCLQTVPQPGGMDGHFCARLVRRPASSAHAGS